MPLGNGHSQEGEGAHIFKGSYHQKFSIAQTLFWSEGPKNHLKLKILVSKFVPLDLEATRT